MPEVVERDDSATWSCRNCVRSPWSENSRTMNQGSSSRLTPRTRVILGSSIEDKMYASASKFSLKEIVNYQKTDNLSFTFGLNYSHDPMT